MNKKTFIQLIQSNKSNFHCLSISNATLVRDNNYYSLDICWKSTQYKTRVLTKKGRHDSIEANAILDKYNNYLKTL